MNIVKRRSVKFWIRYLFSTINAQAICCHTSFINDNLKTLPRLYCLLENWLPAIVIFATEVLVSVCIRYPQHCDFSLQA